jgi:prophage regulatory protein
MADDDAAKWARAEASAAEHETTRERYEDYKHTQALDSRFAGFGPADVLHMFKEGVNEKGQPLSHFEFEALCERWCAVFGELPPMGTPPEDVEPIPVPSDDAMLRMRDVVRITGLSKSTIKRWVGDPANDFPKPVKLSPRRLGWLAHQVMAWRKRIESALPGRSH